MEPLLSHTAHRSARRGFTMIELVFSLGLVTVAVLLLVGLATTSLNARQKARDTEVAQQVARGELQRVVDAALADEPPGFRERLFHHAGSAPFESGEVTVGETRFSYSLVARSLPGTAEPNRLAYLEIEVWWWNEQAGERQGMGRLSYKSSRLLDEPDASS